ncbi:MAG: FMN-binding protein [Desulfobacteraceae bacterium]|nr:FMN-binding protein [Desulfobacteraceae bacterium]
MNEMLKMVVVLTGLSLVSGGVLSYLEGSLKERIENTILEKVQAPTLRQLLVGSENDPVADRFKIGSGKDEKSFFVGIFDGAPNIVVLEAFGNGYGDKVGLMVAIDVTTDKIMNVGVTTHAETPGIGANAKDDPEFAALFEGLPVGEPILVKNDGGEISAMSGATVTSRAVCVAATSATKTYEALKPQVLEQIKGFSK